MSSFFADHTAPVVVHYEDLVRDALGELQRLCDRWNIPLYDDVLPAFSSVPATGFTGGHDTIVTPIRTKRHFEIADEFRKEDQYWRLIEVLGYEDVQEHKQTRQLTKKLFNFHAQMQPPGSCRLLSYDPQDQFTALVQGQRLQPLVYRGVTGT